MTERWGTRPIGAARIARPVEAARWYGVLLSGALVRPGLLRLLGWDEVSIGRVAEPRPHPRDVLYVELAP